MSDPAAREVARLREIQAAVALGLAQADRGELLDGAAVVAELREDLRARRASRKKRR